MIEYNDTVKDAEIWVSLGLQEGLWVELGSGGVSFNRGWGQASALMRPGSGCLGKF